MNKFQTNIPLIEKLPALLAMAGLLFVLLHPFQHVAETVLFEFDSVHHELPSEKKNGTNETDCIKCVLVSSLITDFDGLSPFLVYQCDYLTAFQSIFLHKKHYKLGFSLRAPPVLYV
ncbi:MAG: hypothetical protein EA359_17510 [Balneolaceae bacterium]|nr:MAG: hypothetical protein EA359_17510 [Balneolaceae bacterium]